MVRTEASHTELRRAASASRCSAVLLILALLWTTSGSAATFSVPANTTGAPGGPLSIPITLSDAQNVNGFFFDLSYDPLIAEYQSVEATLPTGWEAPSMNITNGHVRVAASGSSVLSGSATLLNLNFKIALIAVNAQVCPLIFTRAEINDSTNGVATTDGRITVTAATALRLPLTMRYWPGQEFDMPLTVDNADGLVGILVKLEYDAGLIEPVVDGEEHSVYRTPLSAGWEEPAEKRAAGIISVATSGNNPLNGSGELLLFRMRVLPSIPGGVTTYPALMEAELNDGAFAATAFNGVLEIPTPDEGCLKVILQPAAVRTLGALWQADGGPLQISHITQCGLGPGTHSVSFSNVAGYIAPQPTDVVIDAGAVAEITADYVPTGSLKVRLLPAAARDAGARWRVDGGAWRLSHYTEIGLAAGDHTVSFLPITGFGTPPERVLTVSAGQTLDHAETYPPPPPGWLKVRILPAAARDAGARWRVDGGAWQVSHYTLTNVAAGNHTVSFNSVSGWVAPSSRVVQVPSGGLADVAATYTLPGGNLKVRLFPPDVRVLGAMWQVDNRPYRVSHYTEMNLSPGFHIVRFNDIANWTPPAAGIVEIVAGYTLEKDAYYLLSAKVKVRLLPSGARDAGARWKLDGRAWQVSHYTEVDVPPGPHRLTFLDAPGWCTPSPVDITLVEGQFLEQAVTYDACP